MTDNNDIKELLEQARQKRQPRNEQGQFTKRTVLDVAQEIGLNVNDLRVRELASRNVDDPEKEVLRLAVQMHYTRPSDADFPSDVARISNLSQQEALMQEYQEGSKNLRGQAFINFKMKMIQKGLKIS